MQKKTLATEIIGQLKAKSIKQRIAFLAVLCLWLVTIGVFIGYISAYRI